MNGLRSFLLVCATALVLSQANVRAGEPPNLNTRAGFAGMYMAFDRRYQAQFEAGRISAEDRVRVSKEFDALTRDFLMRDPDKAARRLAALTQALPEPAAGFRTPPLIDTSLKPGMTALAGELSARLSRVEIVSPAVMNLMRSRIALLRDVPSQLTAAEFLADRDALKVELPLELDRIERGQHPLSGRRGTFWMTFTSASGMIVPAFVHVPERVTKSPGVVIAFHGIGADESMFVFGYGAGTLCELADQHDLVVISLGTFATMGAGEVLPQVLDQVEAMLPIDREKVYMVGHSLGAIAAWGVVNQHPTLVKGVVVIGAVPGPTLDARRLPPTLLVLGELDHLFKAVWAQDRVREWQAAGAKQVECRIIERTGHTTIVGEELPSIIDWLLKL